MLFDLARDLIRIAGGQPRSRVEAARDAFEALCAIVLGLLVLALTFGIWAFGAYSLFKVVLG